MGVGDEVADSFDDDVGGEREECQRHDSQRPALSVVTGVSAGEVGAQVAYHHDSGDHFDG